MKKRSVLFLIPALILSLTLTACSSDKPTAPVAEQKTITIKGGTAGAPTLPPNVSTASLHKDLEASSGGRLKMEFYESRQLGDDAEVLEQTMNGTIQYGLVSSTMLGKYTPLVDVLQVPFLLSTYEKEFAAARTPEFQAIVKAVEEKCNVRILGVYENGIRHFANNQRSINTMEDLKGLKMRVVPSDLILGTIKALGANPTPLAYGEVYSALQNKVIDGAEINWTSLYSEKFYEQVKYVSEIGLFPFPSVYAVNLDFWKTLSPEDQKLWQDAADKAMDVNLGLMKEIEAKAVDTATKSGVVVNQIKDTAPFVQAVQPIVESYAAKDPLMKSFIEKAKTLK